MNKTTMPLALILMAACTTPGVKDPEGVTAELAQTKARSEQIAKDAAFVPKMMLELDHAIDKFVSARLAFPNERAITLEATLDRMIRQQTQRNFEILLNKALDPAAGGDRLIALASLGFVDESAEQKKLREKNGKPKLNRNHADSALNALVTALRDPDEAVVHNALLGLGVLAHNDTPVHEIGALLEDTKRSRDLRENASWALTSMQDKLTPDKRQAIHPIFQRILMQPLGDIEPPIVCHALRGLGHFRNSRDAKIIEPYCDHPVALVRVRSAIALGQIRNQASFERLVGMIDDKETNLNVRLAARKSLKALAGGKDRGYDVKAWRKLFERK